MIRGQVLNYHNRTAGGGTKNFDSKQIGDKRLNLFSSPPVLSRLLIIVESFIPSQVLYQEGESLYALAPH